MTTPRTTNDAHDQPIAVGQRVRVLRNRERGHEGTVTAIHGSISGDTLISIDDNLYVYGRQVEAVPTP